MRHGLKTISGLAVFGVLGAAIVGVNNCKEQGPHLVPTPTTIKITDTSANLILAAAGEGSRYKKGKPKTLTIQNTGSTDALDVDSNLLSILNVAVKGLVVVENNCPQNLAPDATCTFTFHPGIELKTTKFKIHGINTNKVEATITVLDYGSQYQDGYIYALTPYVFGDDLDQNKCNPDTLEHCSKIVNLAEQNTKTTLWSQIKPPVLLVGDLYNGLKNTKAIMSYISSNQWGAAPAANYCYQLQTKNGYKDWYLPAICEFQSKKNGSTICDQNADDIAALLAIVPDDLKQAYWSSTQVQSIGPNAVYYEDFQNHKQIGSVRGSFDEQHAIRCSRVVTPENVVQ